MGERIEYSQGAVVVVVLGSVGIHPWISWKDEERRIRIGIRSDIIE